MFEYVNREPAEVTGRAPGIRGIAADVGWAEVTSHAAMPHTQNVYRPGRAMQDEFGARNRPLDRIRREASRTGYHRVAAQTGEDGHDIVAG